MCNTYNGHENYLTWNVSLWIDNDYGLYHFVADRAAEIYDNAEPSDYSDKKQTAIYELSEWLEEYIADEMNPLINLASLYSDLLGWALSSANWYDIAESWIDQIEEDL